jgi:hypothetical protein
MCAALPTALFNPLFTEIEQEAESEDVNFAKDSDFLFKCWQCTASVMSGTSTG